MKSNKINILLQLSVAIVVISMASCSERELSTLQPATNPTTAEIFTDGLSGGEDFNAWGKSTDGVISFNETQMVYNGTKSIKIEAPSTTDAPGWVGGVIYGKYPRNFADYNALSFYVKGSTATAMTAGLGTRADGTTPFGVMYKNFSVSTEWKKIIIPIPNSSVLTAETGFFNYSIPGGTAPYQVYIDEIKFEKLSDFYPVKINCDSVFDFTGKYPVNKMTFSETYSMPNGDNATFNTASSYYSIKNIANTSIATMSSADTLSVISAGTTAAVVSNGVFSTTFNIKSTGVARPPIPTNDAANVVALINSGGKYTCKTIDDWWAGATIISAVNVGGKNLFKLSGLDWCCPVFSSNMIDASTKTKLHVDIMVPTAITSSKTFIVEPKYGSGYTVYSGGAKTTTITSLAANTWKSIDLDISGLTPRSQISLLVFSGTIGTVYVDNVYFYK